MITKTILQLTNNSEEQFLLKNVFDKANATIEENYLQSTKFLSEHELTLAASLLKDHCPINYIFWGGYEEAKRKVIIFLPDYIDVGDFTKEIQTYDPLSYLELTLPKNFTLSHRDYLGSLMSLGIKRKVIGDILPRESTCHLIILSEMSDYLIKNYTKAGHISFKIKKMASHQLLKPPKIDSIEKKVVVPSLRLDAYLASVYGLSRTKAQLAVKSNLASVNSHIENKATKLLNVKDTINLRGKGKSIFIEKLSKTSKNNYVIKILLLK